MPIRQHFCSVIYSFHYFALFMLFVTSLVKYVLTGNRLVFEHAQYRVEIRIKPRDYTRLTQKSRGNLCNLVVKNPKTHSLLSKYLLHSYYLTQYLYNPLARTPISKHCSLHSAALETPHRPQNSPLIRADQHVPAILHSLDPFRVIP